MSDREVIISTVGIIVVVFLILGLSAILVQGKEYYENTEVLSSGSYTAQEISLLGGDTVRIKMETSENSSVILLVMKGDTPDYRVVATHMDLTITVPRVIKSTDYNFMIENPHDQPLTVSYLYEVTLIHNFWMGIMWLVFSAILGVAALFALIKKY